MNTDDNPSTDEILDDISNMDFEVMITPQPPVINAGAGLLNQINQANLGYYTSVRQPHISEVYANGQRGYSVNTDTIPNDWNSERLLNWIGEIGTDSDIPSPINWRNPHVVENPLQNAELGSQATMRDHGLPSNTITFSTEEEGELIKINPEGFHWKGELVEGSDKIYNYFKKWLEGVLGEDNIGL